MKRNNPVILTLVLLAAVFITACEKESDMKSKCCPPGGGNNLNVGTVIQEFCGELLTADLYAGKTTRVGTVRVTPSLTGINVTYQLSRGWYLSETHLSVTKSLADVPQGAGRNPKVGKFSYCKKHYPLVTSYTYSGIPTGNNKTLYILAHAVVKKYNGYRTDLTAIDKSLPETVTMQVEYPYEGAPSYFSTTISGGSIIDGTYDGWCLDVDNVIFSNTEYSAKVISSCDPEFATLGLVEYPMNIDMVNWVLNRNYSERIAPNGEAYTYGDIQMAIWRLIEDNVSFNGLGEWSPERVGYIVDDAKQFGDGFTPHCGEFIAIVLKPVNTGMPVQIITAQVSLMIFPGVCVPLYSCPESVWSAGLDFGGNNWAKYFTYCVYE